MALLMGDENLLQLVTDN